MKKYFLLLIICLVIGVIKTNAQQKEWAIGIRLGEPAGLNVKKYFGKGNALDMTLGSSGAFYGGESRNYHYGDYDGYRKSGIALQVNYEWQKALKGVDGLQWYVGVGGMVSSRRFYYRHYYNKNNWYWDNANRVALGATGILGLEWFIPQTPISLNADLGLYMELFPATAWFNVPVGIGGRFNF
jgi:hypothetical protein